MARRQLLRFPEGFTWGAATAAYQIEGAARVRGRGESIWDRFSHTPGRVADGSTGDIACDHYHRWRQDIELMRQLNLNAYRFSISWPRILPTGRAPANEQGLDFYDRLLDGLLAADITPWVTLYHWDLPQPLEDAGGWPARATAARFADYVEVVVRRLGDRVKHWITLNEPWCSAFLGYYRGVHAPGRTSFAEALHAAHILLLGHSLAVPLIREHSAGAQVGITLNLQPVYPATPQPADKLAAIRFDGFVNRWFLDPCLGRGYPRDMQTLYGDLTPEIEPGDLPAIAAPLDFLGVNYYYPAFVADAPGRPPLDVDETLPPNLPRTHNGWVVDASGLSELLLRLHREYLIGTIYVTENGAAFADPQPAGDRVADPERRQYLVDHLASVYHGVQQGVPARGYFVWSLLDNFEWALGYTVRFGLTYVDYPTQRRTLKDSGRWYAGAAADNGFVIPSSPGAEP